MLFRSYPKSSENDVEKLKSDLSAFTDMTKWNFLAMNKETIQNLHKNLKTEKKLDTSLYSNRVYLLDKELNLRGRDLQGDDENQIMYGYNIESVAELNNKMEDDIKVLLYEYRAAFKNKNKADRKN